MAEIVYNEHVLATLRGKVIVLTGGAQGIGAATVAMLYHAGAHVVFGDWDSNKGAKLEQVLGSEDGQENGTVRFLQVDVRDYRLQLALFEVAYETYGRVDVAICLAAVGEPGGWFEPENLDLDSVRKEPTPLKDIIDINLTAVVSFSRLALAFTKADNRKKGHDSNDKQFSKAIILVSSVAGFKESPGLFAYSAAKHGVIGLMRALRPYTPLKYNVRVNAICPWATDTQLLAGVRERWVEGKMPMNTSKDVARMILQSAGDHNIHGKAIYVAGGRGFDVEEGINRLEPGWLGEQQSLDLNHGQIILGLGGDWSK